MESFVMCLLLKLYLLLCEGKPQGVAFDLGLFYQKIHNKYFYLRYKHILTCDVRNTVEPLISGHAL